MNKPVSPVNMYLFSLIHLCPQTEPKRVEENLSLSCNAIHPRASSAWLSELIFTPAVSPHPSFLWESHQSWVIIARSNDVMLTVLRHCLPSAARKMPCHQGGHASSSFSPKSLQEAEAYSQRKQKFSSPYCQRNCTRGCKVASEGRLYNTESLTWRKG